MDNHPSIPRPAGHYTLQERETIITSTARIESANAPRYLARLCRHFSHKRQVERTETEGQVEFDMGTCVLEARDSVLTLKAVATTAEDLSKVQQVIGSHLERFAAAMKDGEQLTVSWQPAQ